MRRRDRKSPVTVEEVVSVGCGIGLRGLSIMAVAGKLGVTGPAVYKYVSSREELERLVAAEFLSEIDFSQPLEDARSYIINCTRTIYIQCQKYPGLSRYLQRRIPSDPESVRLREEVRTVMQGYGFNDVSIVKIMIATFSVFAASMVQVEELNATALPQENRSETDTDLGGLLGNLDRFSLIAVLCVDGMLERVKPGMSKTEVICEIVEHLPILKCMHQDKSTIPSLCHSPFDKETAVPVVQMSKNECLQELEKEAAGRQEQ